MSAVNLDKQDGDGRQRRRIIRLRVEQERYELLERAASDAAVTVEGLVGVWIGDRIDQMAVPAMNRLVRMLADQVGEASGLASADAPRGTERGGKARRRGSLHDEIVEVLRDGAGPMTAAEIAREIRERGAYRSPRSGQPITGTAVSRRVANPIYRSLFERDGRRLSLAESARDRSG